MQLTINIPETLYRKLESQAKEDHTSLEHLMIDGAESVVARTTKGERISEKEPRLVDMNVNFNDFALMSDDEIELFEKIADIDPESALKAFGIRRLNEAA